MCGRVIPVQDGSEQGAPSATPPVSSDFHHRGPLLTSPLLPGHFLLRLTLLMSSECFPFRPASVSPLRLPNGPMRRRKQREGLGDVSGLRCVRGWKDGEVPVLTVPTAILVTFLSLIQGRHLLSASSVCSDCSECVFMCLNVPIWLRH